MSRSFRRDRVLDYSPWSRRTAARQYAVNGERRSFALLRPIADTAAQDRIRELVLNAYVEFEERVEASA